MSIRKVKISSVGHYVPDHILSNYDLEQMVDTNDEWIRTRTGIIERRILNDPDKATAFMSTEAGKQALENAGMSPDELDAIIVATVTPDYMFPATACLVQNNLDAVNAFAYDLSAACSGFVYAVSTGTMMIESGRYDKVLIIGADKMSSIIDYTDRTTCIIFGDAAGAVILEPSDDETGIIDFVNHTEGDDQCTLYQHAGGSLHPASEETVRNKQHTISQEGRVVFKRATEGMADVSVEIMEKNNLNADDIAWLVPHQANKRIIDATARRMGLSEEKVMINIQKYGNTTAATIPLCLYDWKDQLKYGDNLIMSAFGGGFTWGAVYLKWSIKS